MNEHEKKPKVALRIDVDIQAERMQPTDPDAAKDRRRSSASNSLQKETLISECDTRKKRRIIRHKKIINECAKK